MLLNLPKKISIKNNYFMLDIRHNKQRHRLLTIFEAIEDNLPKVENLLNKIKKDLNKNLFYISNYEKYFKNIGVLKSLDAEYSKNSRTAPLKMKDLIQKEATSYYNRVHKGTLGLATYENYIYAINLHTIPFFSNYYLHEIDGNILEKFIKTIPFSRKRIELIFRPLKNIFDDAVRKDILVANPLTKIDPKVYLEICPNSDYEVNPCSQYEIEKILANCKHETIQNFIQFGFWTGMRIGEIFALEWSDISFESETISITKSASIKGIIKTTKTPAGVRELEMTPKAKEALLKQYNISGNQNDRVFLTPNKCTWKKTSTFGEYWKQALMLAGIKYRNPYQMRHTFISTMLLLGNNPMILYKMVGHKNPKIMYEKYARFIKYKSTQKLLITTDTVPKLVPN